MLSCIRLLVTPWTVDPQAPPSMGFSREEYLNGLPFPPPGDLPDPGIEPASPAMAGRFFPAVLSGKPIYYENSVVNFFGGAFLYSLWNLSSLTRD